MRFVLDPSKVLSQIVASFVLKVLGRKGWSAACLHEREIRNKSSSAL